MPPNSAWRSLHRCDLIVSTSLVFFEQLPQQDSAGKPLNKGWELVSGIQIKALKPIIFICIKEGFFFTDNKYRVKLWWTDL